MASPLPPSTSLKDLRPKQRGAIARTLNEANLQTFSDCLDVELAKVNQHLPTLASAPVNRARAFLDHICDVECRDMTISEVLAEIENENTLGATKDAITVLLGGGTAGPTLARTSRLHEALPETTTTSSSSSPAQSNHGQPGPTRQSFLPSQGGGLTKLREALIGSERTFGNALASLHDANEAVPGSLAMLKAEIGKPPSWAEVLEVGIPFLGERGVTYGHLIDALIGQSRENVEKLVHPAPVHGSLTPSVPVPPSPSHGVETKRSAATTTTTTPQAQQAVHRQASTSEHHLPDEPPAALVAVAGRAHNDGSLAKVFKQLELPSLEDCLIEIQGRSVKPSGIAQQALLYLAESGVTFEQLCDAFESCGKPIHARAVRGMI